MEEENGKESSPKGCLCFWWCGCSRVSQLMGEVMNIYVVSVCACLPRKKWMMNGWL
ncbi:hypothetical protein RchiOBHm_Chr4g0400711 [Rosa chinensis]|uniref:Uncharacterized protein n=1 Tax=Rosa chinensis TaxID=74649 RepID=A0A2P6QSX5_ROSCH|nr:hypothetical protein RchiOBHm_Chr4g0400711 [Rosa chinensis]